MSFASTIGLGAVAGLTIYLGLPFARMRHAPRALQAFFNAIATGILIFLLWDVISKASEKIDTAMTTAKAGSPGDFVLLTGLFVGGFGLGLMGLVYFERNYIKGAAKKLSSGEVGPTQLALMIAVGIGVHNFAEGLAIGQSAASGAIGLATVLIIGFGLHNATEGFGIAAPLALGTASWRFLALAGLIGGGPTFFGTVIGYRFQSDAVFVLCLALAAGSILYVVGELLNAGRKFNMRDVVMWGVFLGFVAGYGTDLLVTWAGA
jgi:ZIP family zinc transporter